MTLHKLSAGSGYEYLTRQVAAHDSTEKGRTALADYYSAKGESPGRWVGSGLVGIDGLEAGDVVTAEQMNHLFGSGCDPLSGLPLGSAYRVYSNEVVDAFNAEVDSRLKTRGKESIGESASVRSEVAREFFVREHGRVPASPRELSAALVRYSRPRQGAVAGFDLTFSPVKSVSALWAVAPREVADAIEAAHNAAVADALHFIEAEVLFAREGKDGARQVETRGLIGAAFTHRDSRAGDPDLHTHVAVANKVQTLQGKWLATYGRVLHQNVVAASETYNTALECRLNEALGVQFVERPGGAREKRPVREIEGVDLDLCKVWSQRRADIVAGQRALSAEFQRAHGRPPTPVEAVRLAQQANLQTRDAKHEPRSLAEQRGTWRTEAVDVLGTDEAIGQMVQAALHPRPRDNQQVTAGWIQETAARVICEVEAHRATWQVWHLRAEGQRQIRGAAIPAEQVATTVQLIVDDAIGRLSINLTPDLDPISEPGALRRSDGTSVYRHTDRDHYSSTRILDAEKRVVAAAARTDGFAWTGDDVELAVLAARVDGVELNEGQENLVRQMATSGRRVQLALAPAGAGKTTAMRVLAGVWTEGGLDVIGLAPSAAAAAALGDATGMRCETLAKFAYDLTHVPDSSLVSSVGPGTLVVIDEAGMADTLTLDRVIGHAVERGASVRLIGDDQQLAAIGAGGVLRDIAITHGVVKLDQLVRFNNPAEANASLALRQGDRGAFGFYLDHERIHAGDPVTCVDDVFDAWQHEQAAGRDCLMLAQTRDLVRDLNDRARTTRLAGSVPEDEVQLSDGTCASVGDVVITRRNDRRLGVTATDWVKNGDRWAVTASRAGRLTVRHASSGLTTVLPAEYVAAHVELGYASTVHTAQGITADVTHGIITGEENRQMLYTMITRGRAENHVHVVLTNQAEGHQLTLPGMAEQVTATEILDRVLARDGAAISATSTATIAASPEARLHEAVVRYADAVALVSTRMPVVSDEAATDGGPLPWLAQPPELVAEHPTWGPYIEARARLVAKLAEDVGTRAETTLPEHLHRYDDILTPELRTDIAVWRAARGFGPNDRTLVGPVPDSDREASYHHQLVRRINDSYGSAVKVWENRVIEYVGHRDDGTLELAQMLDRLGRHGHDAERLLTRAAASRPLPDEYGSAALVYRIREHLTPKRGTPDTPRRAVRTRIEPPTPLRPQNPSPGIGL